MRLCTVCCSRERWMTPGRCWSGSQVRSSRSSRWSLGSRWLPSSCPRPSTHRACSATSCGTGPNQLFLSVIVATFTYSAAGLYTVGESGQRRTDSYPQLAVTFAIVLLFASLGALLVLLQDTLALLRDPSREQALARPGPAHLERRRTLHPSARRPPPSAGSGRLAAHQRRAWPLKSGPGWAECGDRPFRLGVGLETVAQSFFMLTIVQPLLAARSSACPAPLV